MSDRNRRKVPKSLNSPSESKTPKAGVVPSDQLRPEFRTDQMDMEGPWGWNQFDPLQIKELFQKIFESQKLTWQELRNNGSHLVNRNIFCPEAQKRLIQIKQDDLDELFSLRITARKRVWGIKDGNLLWLLWWDPEHTVCPSPKKHT